MFVRKKVAKGRVYLQIVKNYRDSGKVKQLVVATLGRLEDLQASGELESLIRSSAKFADAFLVLDARARGEATTVACQRLGAPLVFERLWRDTGCQEVIQRHLEGRKFGFPVERALFLTVLHRLLVSGSDRAAEKWRRDYHIEGVEELDLHQLYRAMAWLGEELPEGQQDGRTPFSPRCTKDLVEEALFGRRRDLFSSLTLVLLDTTSIFFYGRGGETLGQRGYSRDKKPHLKQMVVALVIDETGRPICCELWPGNTTDVSTLIPVVERLQKRFGIDDICIVADRGLLSSKTVAELESKRWNYILGARLRAHKEVTDEVLARAGRYSVVTDERGCASDPAPLKVKEVYVEDRRYIVCLNEDQRRKDEADRAAILEALSRKLKEGDKAFVGNKGFRRFLKPAGKHFEIDQEVVKREARYDGKWVLRTNTSWPAGFVAFCYKHLWMVEALFRDLKSLLETRPIFHQRDCTIRGHVFCSFLALVLRRELQDRLRQAGHTLEWKDIIRDLESLTNTEVEHGGKRVRLRSEALGVVAKVFQSVGLALPPTVQRLDK